MLAFLFGALVVVPLILGVVRFPTASKLQFALLLFNGPLIIAWGTIKIIRSHRPPLRRHRPPYQTQRPPQPGRAV